MFFRKTTIWFYRQMTARSRQRLLEQLREQRQMPIAVLFYHRVADHQMTPWTISTSDFKRHLDWLQENYEIVSLEESQRRIRQPFNDKFTLSLTFDDGYSENVVNALPELVSRNVPATYFVTTDFLSSGRLFQHDEEIGCNAPPNTWDELKSFVGQGIEFGAHTRSHCDFSTLSDPSVLRHELIGSIRKVEQELGVNCRYFAFPYGQPKHLTPEAVEILHQHGIQGICSAYGALNWPGRKGFHIRRFHGDPCIERVKNWLTLDRRHLDDSHVKLLFDEPSPVLASHDSMTSKS